MAEILDRTATPADDRLGALEAVRKALRLELHNLAERPKLTWQQLYNRLQWVDPPLSDILAVEQQQRARRGNQWINRYSRLREGEALVRTLVGHTGSVNACAVSPDGTWIVSASADNTLRIWDAASGTERATLSGHAGSVTACCVSPDGTWIVSASEDGTLKIWDAANGSERATLTGHAGRVYACAVSPDGTWIVSAGADSSVKVWDVERGAVLDTLVGHNGAVMGCAVSPDGTWIVSASADETLKIWVAATGTERATLGSHASGANACCVSPDGTRIVSAGDDSGPPDTDNDCYSPTVDPHMLGSWTLSRDDTWIGSVIGDPTLNAPLGHIRQVRGCATSPDGTWIVSASDDQTLKIWDAATEAERATLIGHASGVNACCVSPDGTWIVSASSDRTLKIWDAASAAKGANLAGHTEAVNGCAVSPDGTWIVSTSDYPDITPKIWDVATGTELRALSRPYFQGVGCAVSPDGTWIVSPRSSCLGFWDVATGKDGLKCTVGHTEHVLDCAVSPDGSWVVSGSADRTLKIWGVAADSLKILDQAAHMSARVTLKGHTDAIYACAVGPDGTWIVSASKDGNLKIWDAASGAERATLKGHAEAVRDCAVSPDGIWIVSAGCDHTLKIWDASTGLERATLAGHVQTVTGCAVSPDGAWIASVSLDCNLKIWDVATGTERATLVLPGMATAVTFHPSAAIVVCGDHGGGVHFARLMGAELGPLVVTAALRGPDLTVRCPACRETFPVGRDLLGTETTCPRPACGRRLRVNPFTLKRVTQ
jgi:WD40 repeat protein